MFSCMVGTVALLTGWALILTGRILVGEAQVIWVNGLAYAVLAIAAMALVSRCAPEWHAALKRVSALLACAVMAGVDVGLSGPGGEAGQKLFFAALLGIALVILAARHAPKGLRRKWLGEGGV